MEKGKLPDNALLIGVLTILKEASVIDIANLHIAIIKLFESRVDTNYSDKYNEEIFCCNLGKYSLKEGVDIEKYLESIYEQFTDSKLLAVYKQAIQK